MTDFMSQEQRSRAMSRVRGSETQLERAVRSGLHKMGFRFRKNVSSLPGKPDVVMPKYKAVVFVHGCFWHGHTDCPAAKLPQTNREFWKNKIAANIVRDKRQLTDLRQRGWRTALIWECSVKANSTRMITALADWLRSEEESVSIQAMHPPEREVCQDQLV